jgi:uncharacterized protein
MMTKDLVPHLLRIADALERLAPPRITLGDPARSDVFAFNSAYGELAAVTNPRRIPLDFILGIESQKARLLRNTQCFAKGHPANHALLWGARGTGKSALVKAAHAQVANDHPDLKLIEIARGDIASVPGLATDLAAEKWRAILFIDDLSFERGDESYKALKSVLDGGVSGALSNLLVYVTSNRGRTNGLIRAFWPLAWLSSDGSSFVA